jgi:DNA-binding GntR family transcriptional regulator
VKWEKAVEEHQEMLDALKAHDSKRMRKIMIQHVQNKRDVVVQLLNAEAEAKTVATSAVEIIK